MSFRAGDPWPDNAWFNEQLRIARRGRVVAVGPGLEVSGGALAVARPARIWAKLSGSAPAYGFAEVTPAASGRFAPLPGGRTDAGGRMPAYEANGVAGLAGTIQRLRPSPAGDWRFADVRAGSGGAPSNYIIMKGCFCPVPPTLAMTSADPGCNYGMFQSCTLRYGPPPAAFAPLSITGPVYLSTREFLDPIANSNFYYHLFCQYNQFSLTRLYPTSPYGSPFRDGTLYTWLVGGYGNVCNPFHLHNGTSFPGSDATCSVAIDPA